VVCRPTHNWIIGGTNEPLSACGWSHSWAHASVPVRRLSGRTVEASRAVGAGRSTLTQTRPEGTQRQTSTAFPIYRGARQAARRMTPRPSRIADAYNSACLSLSYRHERLDLYLSLYRASGVRTICIGPGCPSCHFGESYYSEPMLASISMASCQEPALTVSAGHRGQYFSVVQPNPPASAWRMWLNASSGESARTRYQTPGLCPRLCRRRSRDYEEGTTGFRETG